VVVGQTGRGLLLPPLPLSLQYDGKGREEEQTPLKISEFKVTGEH